MVRIFRALVPILVLALLFGDLLIAGAGFLGAVWLQTAEIAFFLAYEDGALQVALVLMVLFLGFYFQDFYSLRNLSHSLVLQKILVAIGVVLLFEALASTIDPQWALPRRIMLIGGLATIAGIFGWHALLRATVAQTTSRQRVVFLGASPAVFELAEHMTANPELGLAPAGYIDPEPDRECSLPWLGPAERCLEIIDAQEPAWIIIGRPEELSPRWVDDFLELRFGGVRIEQVNRLFEESLGRVCSRQLRLADLAVWEPFEPGLAVRLQTALSSAVAVVLLVALAPVLGSLAVLVKLSSGSVLTRTRVAGLYGVPFSLYRFQCTHESAGHRNTTLLGRILLALKLAGWPQLLNVASGEMSFIGPSPQRVEFSQRLSSLLPFYPQRHILKPGLMGWAKMKSLPGDDAVRQLEYDLYYSKHALRGASATTDLLILTGLLKQFLERAIPR